jgi:hypothetical protein
MGSQPGRSSSGAICAATRPLVYTHLGAATDVGTPEWGRRGVPFAWCGSHHRRGSAREVQTCHRQGRDEGKGVPPPIERKGHRRHAPPPMEEGAAPPALMHRST